MWAVTKVFFFNDTATTEVYTLSLHDALPIYPRRQVHGGLRRGGRGRSLGRGRGVHRRDHGARRRGRSEEHTSELQSRPNFVFRLLLEKKKNRLPFPLPACLRTHSSLLTSSHW